MADFSTLPIETRKKIYREALDEIRKNQDQWYRGDKFLDQDLGRNDGDFLANEIEIIIHTAMDKGGVDNAN